MGRRPSSRRCSTNMRARNRSIGAARGFLRKRFSPRPRRPVSRKSSGSSRTGEPMEALTQARRLALRSQGDAHRRRAARFRPRHAARKSTGLLRALDGRFVEPGPAGAPSRGRLDVLPTGRNLFTIDPRAVPTRTAWEIGSRTASEVMTRHAQDHGDWPRRIVIDLWGSATMRTGGDDIAQGLVAPRRAPALGQRLDARLRASRSCRSPSSAGRASM